MLLCDSPVGVLYFLDQAAGHTSGFLDSIIDVAPPPQLYMRQLKAGKLVSGNVRERLDLIPKPLHDSNVLLMLYFSISNSSEVLQYLEHNFASLYFSFAVKPARNRRLL